MKKIIVALSLFLSTSVFAQDFENVQYVKNYDGDTVTVNIQGVPDIFGNNMPIRVLGIDTPEMKGKCEKEKSLARIAKSVVTEILKNAKSISLRNCVRGKYFRMVCDVYGDEESVSKHLILDDLAVPYDGGTKVKDWCE